MKNKIDNQKGFTITELLLAITLFAILIPVIIFSLSNLSMANQNIKDLTTVNIIAENTLEELRASGFNSIDAGTTDISSTLPASLGNPRSASYTVDNDTPGLKEITLSITYTNRRGTSTIDYKSVISELGVAQ